MNGPQFEVVKSGQLFQWRERHIEGRDKPYEFMGRIGAVTVMPILEGEGEPQVLGIHNTRAGYQASIGYPGGQLDGGFDDPESPYVAGLRELREETGHGYVDGQEPNQDVFLMRPVSSTIDYPRFFSVTRGVSYIGGEDENPREVVELRPEPLDDCVDQIVSFQREEQYPEVILGFAKAAQRYGSGQLVDWLHTGEFADGIVPAMEPYLVRVPENTTGPIKSQLWEV